MAVTELLDVPYYTGTGTTSLVPAVFPVALNGRPYQLDLNVHQRSYGAHGYRHVSIPQLRQQADQSSRPSEASVNPEDFWRRGMDSWHKGAGQNVFDRPDSDEARFRSSKGINPWNRWSISLLPDTFSLRTSTNTNLACLSCGSYLYFADDNEVYFRSGLTGADSAANIAAGEAAQAVKAITTDGNYVYAALGSGGIHRTARGTTSSSHYSDLTCSLIGYVKGRLMAANGASLYNVTASGAAPAALFTHPNTDFSWVGFADGLGQIYAAGFSGDRSLIYRTAIKPDGTALDVPVVAAELPAGEVVRSIKRYLGLVMIGTDSGVRVATMDSTGDLTIGALIETGVPVRCFEGQSRFIWFGWTNYDASSTGLGRIDPTVFNGSAPAYASDLMASAQGDVLSIATIAKKRVFAVSGAGFFGEDTNLVATGTLDSGEITYGLPDPKVALFVDVRHRQLKGSHAAYLAADGGTFVSVGSHSTDGSTSLGVDFPAGDVRGERFEIRTELSRSATDTTAGPTVTRITLRSRPTAVLTGRYIDVPLLLHEDELGQGKTASMDPGVELSAIASMRAAGVPVIFQEGKRSYRVFVEDYIFFPHNLTRDGKSFNGTVMVQLKVIS